METINRQIELTEFDIQELQNRGLYKFGITSAIKSLWAAECGEKETAASLKVSDLLVKKCFAAFFTALENEDSAKSFESGILNRDEARLKIDNILKLMGAN